MRKFTKHFLALSLILCTIVLFSCKKDEEKTGSRKIVYKAIGSAGTNVSIAVVSTDGSGGVETFTSLTGSTWTSKEYTFPSSAVIANVGVTGTGPLATSTLTVQVWVDGELKAEGNSTGTVLSAQASHNIK